MNPESSWDYIKYKIGQHSRNYSKRLRRCEIENKENLEEQLDKLGKDPINNKEEYITIRKQLDDIKEEEDKTIIFRSRVKWVEEGEKCTNYFFRKIESNQKKRQY